MIVVPNRWKVCWRRSTVGLVVVVVAPGVLDVGSVVDVRPDIDLQVRVAGGVDDNVVDRECGEDEGDEEEEDKRCQKGQRFAEVNVEVEGDEGRNDCDGVVVVVERHRLGELWVVLGTLFYNFLSAM